MSKKETPQAMDAAENEQSAQTGETVAEAATEVSTEMGEETQEKDALTVLEEQLAAARQEVQQNIEGRQRTLAEFQNYKRRVERERTELYQMASFDAIKKVLPILDDFERALANIPDELADNPWLEGVTLIQRKFEKLLEEHAIVALDPVGEEFNPNQHEAIGIDPNADVESGHVSETLQKGYVSGDVVLRPAVVRVAG